MAGLFGEDFEIKLKEVKVKDLLNKQNKVEEDPEKILKSKKISLAERLVIIEENVMKVLGHYKDNILVIKDKITFDRYIAEAIKAGRIDIDTETNNSLDPITCKLMGLCLYYPGGKQAYVPINHIDNDTEERLAWQLTEEDCREELQKVLDSRIIKVFHNNKFDYKVIKCTCNIEVPADWDTLIGAYLIDENEVSHGLKQLYISHVDKMQEKYSIEHLFQNVLYEQVDPEIFAYYAATDAWMTDALYLYQKDIMEQPGYEKVYSLFKEVEVPCIQATAQMELNGIRFDNDYAARLNIVFEEQLAGIDAEINKELEQLKPKIDAWKLTPEAVRKPMNKSNTGYGKSKLEQLDDPISMSSPTQLAILIYDILKFQAVDKKSPRGTGEEVLEKLKSRLPLADLLLKRRGTVKLLDAFINSLPEEVNKKTGKIHCSFNQYGAKTGRFSCSAPNLQQIPSHQKFMRLLFTADTESHSVELTDNFYTVPSGDEVKTPEGWKKVKTLQIGDILLGEATEEVISKIEVQSDNYLLYVYDKSEPALY